MAKIHFIQGQTSRRKKWEHFKLKCRHWVFKASLLSNIYLAYEAGYMDKYIAIAKPFLKDFIEKL